MNMYKNIKDYCWNVMSRLTVRQLGIAVARNVSLMVAQSGITCIRLPQVRERHTEMVASAITRLRPIFQSTSLGEWFTNYAARQAPRITQDIAYVDEFLKGDVKSVLEIGGIPYVFTEALSSSGYPSEVRSMDIDPGRIALPEGFNFKTIKYNVETNHLAADYSNAFDTIFLHEVFEHMRLNPFQLLRDIRACLKPGGTLSITTPNLHAGFRLAWLVKEGWAGPSYEEYTRLTEIGHMGHAREYSLLEMIRWLGAAGYSDIKLIMRGSERQLNLYRGLGRYLLPLTHLVARG
jgi:SAM-dependent methyltransferase